MSSMLLSSLIASLELVRHDSGFEFVDALLQCSPISTLPSLCDPCVGVPRSPLVATLADQLEAWSLTRSCPVFHRSANLPPLLIESTNTDLPEYHALRCVEPLVYAIHDASHKTLQQIVLTLGVGGCGLLLGLRHTAGSDFSHLPLTYEQCLDSFNARHSPQTKALLTVGARALSKHCLRDVTNRFWGPEMTGSELQKNMRAEAVLKRIIDHAVWLNMHRMVHDVLVFEARCLEGYGCRWSVGESIDFRGFLEPQMENGHEVGWRH